MLGTIAAWRAYATERGNAAPTSASDADANAALVRASDYIIYTYVSQFMSGYDETLPIVTLAAYEAANFELSKPNFFTSTYTPSQQKVLTGVDSIRWSVVGETDSSEAWANATPTSTKISSMLSAYMSGKTMVGLRSIGA